MLAQINDKLSLSAPTGQSVLGMSKPFSMSSSENALSLSFVFMSVTGDEPVMILFLDETDDDENWVNIASFGVSPEMGLFIASGFPLAAKTYRISYLLLSDTGGEATCVVAATVETSHV